MRYLLRLFVVCSAVFSAIQSKADKILDYYVDGAVSRISSEEELTKEYLNKCLRDVDYASDYSSHSDIKQIDESLLKEVLLTGETDNEITKKSITNLMELRGELQSKEIKFQYILWMFTDKLICNFR